MKKKLLSIIFLTIFLSASSAQGTIEEGWELWSKAELEKAEKISSYEKILKNQKPWIFND